MKAFSILLSIAFISLLLPATATEQSESHKLHSKKSVRPSQKNAIKNHSKKVASIKAKQRKRIQQAGFDKLEPANFQANRKNGLPNTRLDSFVLNSGSLSEAIYGDEGSSGPPPYFGFGPQHRIQSGIYIRGLSTENSRQYIYDAAPSLWSDWRLQTGDFDYTLRHRIERDQVEE